MNEMFQKNVPGMGCMQINKLTAPFQCLFKCFLKKKKENDKDTTTTNTTTAL